MTPFNVSNKRVVVTGAAQGIGYAVAKAFAIAGADLVMLDISKRVEESASMLSREVGRKMTSHHCDIADRANVYATVGALGHIDVLVNNAGVGNRTPIMGPRDEVDEEFMRVIEINLTGHFFVTRAALPLIEPGGRIIFTASIWSKAAGPEYTAYCASKHGIIGMMRALAHELGPRGITVNAVCPGTIRTELNEKHITEEARNLVLASMVINRGWIEPDELANLYVFLASPAAKDITGQAYNYDRGQVMA